MIQLPVLVGLSDTGEVLQHVLNGELHGDSRPRVAAVYQALKVLVLPNELILHGVPNNLMDRAKFTFKLTFSRISKDYKCNHIQFSHLVSLFYFHL